MRMKFYFTDIEEIKQSAFYPVSKSEVIEYFRNGQNDINAFEKIEQHNKLEFMLPGDRGTLYRFFPVDDEDYFFQMTISVDNMPPLDEDLVKIIENKDIIEPKNREDFRFGPRH